MTIHFISPLDYAPRNRGARRRSWNDLMAAASSSSSSGSGSGSGRDSTDFVSPDASATPSAAPPRILPLTSFANTPQNVACISFLLGSTFAVGLAILALGVDGNEAVGWTEALRGRKLGGYVASWALFHLLEYVVTATYNPTRVQVSSFLLNNGKAYHMAHSIGLLEFVLEETFLPRWLKAYKHLALPTCLGAILVIVGQYVRTLAMVTAAQSFTHYVSLSKKPDHTLVTSGVYSVSRHPSYAAFLYWAVGTQIWLGNPVGVVGFALVLWRFFNARIKEEEKYLVHFFGRQYEDFRARVGTKIPFIH